MESFGTEHKQEIISALEKEVSSEGCADKYVTDLKGSSIKEKQ